MNRLGLSLLVSGLLVTEAFATTAYLPSPQTGNLRPTASVQWARDFWFDDNPATLPGHLTQTTMGFEAEYGLAPDLALDLSTGFSWVNYQGGPLGGLVLTRNNQNKRNGLADTHVGVSWRVIDEFASVNEAMPTVTLRAGAILAGTYDTGFLNAVSDGADGFELGAKFGKILFAANAGLYGDFTYRWRSTTVPDEWEASLGAFKSLGPATWSVGLRNKEAVGGIDILGPGFTLARFTDVREKNLSAEFGLTWNFSATSSASIGYARTLDGENTPKKNVVVISTSLAF